MSLSGSASIAQEYPAARSRRVAEEHFNAESTNDPEVIMRTMLPAGDLVTVLVEKFPDGRRLTQCRTVAEQWQHYDDIRTRLTVHGAELFTSVGSDWYGFVHGVVDVEIPGVGPRRNEMLGLLPVHPTQDVIVGEIGLARPADAKRGDAPGAPPVERAATLALHEAWLAAARDADADGLVKLYAPDALAGARYPGEAAVTGLRGPAAIGAFYSNLFAQFAIDRVEVVLRIVDTWYVFTELAWHLREDGGGPQLYRSAHAAVVGEDDRILVDLGYGTDLGAPGS